MADENVTPEVEADDTASAPEEQPYESESARYQRIRSEAKAQAAVDMEKAAKKAKAARDKRLKKVPTDPDETAWLEQARALEAKANEKKEA